MLFGYSIKELIGYIVAVIVTAIVTTVLGFIGSKYDKSKKTSYNLVNYIDIIQTIMPEIMNKYESIFRNGNGDKKKELVMNELTAYCIEHKIDYTNDVLSSAVDNYCKVSKTINKGK